MSAALTWEMVDAAAAALGAGEAARRKWRQIGRQVPDAWRIRIAEKLKADGHEVEFSAFDDLPPRPGKLGAHDDGSTAAIDVDAPGKGASGSLSPARRAARD